MNAAYNLDCIEAMKQIPDHYFDLAVADPPYGRKEHGGKNAENSYHRKTEQKYS